MAQDLAAVVAAWQVPLWAQSSDPDGEAVVHSCRVGVVPDLDGDELSVELVQRDEWSFATEVAAVARDTAWVSVGGVRISIDRAARLALLLLSAGEMVEVAAEPGLSLRVERYPE